MIDPRPALVVALPPGDEAGPWVDVLQPLLPGCRVASVADAGDPAGVRYAAAWKHETGALAPFTQLDVLFSLGAGVDHMLADPTLPTGVPLVRVIDPDLKDRMAEWVCLHVLLHHRQQRMYDYQQFEKIWADDLDQPAARDVRVGVMGLGRIGADAAGKLKALGFDVAGWSRSPKSLPDIPTFHGPDGLPGFLARTQMLVVLLPLTPDTRGLLARPLFEQLARDGHPGGPILLNAGRGALQDEADIVACLEDGTLRAATLDVFRTEPLPEGSPLWHCPGLTITPHNASISSPGAVGRYIAAQVRAFEAGLPLDGIVDRAAGY